MSYEEIQAVIAQMLAVDRQLQERQLSHESQIAELSDSLKKTEEIVNSNARAIEALGNKTSELDNKMSNLIQIVGEFAQATNKRLEIIENK